MKPLLLIGLITLAAPALAQQFQLPADAPPAAAGPAGDPVIERCIIGLVEDIRIPASDAGVLTHLAVKQGSVIRSEDVIARVDAREVEAQRNAAKYAVESALQRWKDDIEERFARAQLEHAKSALKEIRNANKDLQAVTNDEVRTAELNVKRSELAIEKAQHDRTLAGHEYWVKKAELELAQIAVDKRTIFAPFDGVVLEVLRHQNEWVSPGDPIVRVIKLDTLQVDGYVRLDDYSPSQIDGCEVTVEVNVGPGRTIPTAGRIVNIDPIAGTDGKGSRYLVRAEIANRQEDGRWLILSRLPAKMTIHLGTGGISSAAAPRGTGG
ncbi:multidrug resistance protein MdtN [Pirellulimonas nuda]|uniref:Multidrug resistance protein MdtN n=1 Tax=Pirellulimonas nuda TaxID=2528009 RepID=A0A518D6S8_9BACT|nr:HlyD family efflux transporter periplasmic adaptor subunit [Pirellulimonas nuda]QDU87161.1 multidrug resistance protein MdtN [Pirellulimonas nuda]